MKIGNIDIDKLYVGSTSVEKLYIGDVLVWEDKIWLYNNGVQSALSGAWYYQNHSGQKKYTTTSGSETYGSYSITFNADNIYATATPNSHTGYGGEIAHDIMVDLTNFTKLEIDSAFRHTDPYDRGYIQLTNGTTTNTLMTVNNADYPRAIRTFDISSYTGSWRVLFGTGVVSPGYSARQQVWGVWLK